MALSNPRTFITITQGAPTFEIRPASPWTVAVGPGGPSVQDAGTITNPDSQITDATRRIVRREGIHGNACVVRMKYDSNLTGITPAIVKLFGRASPNDAWELLYTRSGNLTATLADDSADVDDGDFKYTTVHPNDHVWESAGCDEFLLGVEQALAGSGVVNNSEILIRSI